MDRKEQKTTKTETLDPLLVGSTIKSPTNLTLMYELRSRSRVDLYNSEALYDCYTVDSKYEVVLDNGPYQMTYVGRLATMTLSNPKQSHRIPPSGVLGGVVTSANFKEIFDPQFSYCLVTGKSSPTLCCMVLSVNSVGSNFDSCGISNQRLKTDSDGRIVDYCQQCTQMAVRNSALSLAWCQQCFTGDYVISIRGPHAHMLCQQEWFCMGYAQYMTFVDEKVPVSYIPQEGVVDRSRPFPQSEWAKLMQLPRLQPYEHRRLGTSVPDTIHNFLRNLPSIHRPFGPKESRFQSHPPQMEWVSANEVEQVRISAADASALLAGEVPKTARGRALVGPEYVIEASVINNTRPQPHVVAWYHNRVKADALEAKKTAAMASSSSSSVEKEDMDTTMPMNANIKARTSDSDKVVVRTKRKVHNR